MIGVLVCVSVYRRNMLSTANHDDAIHYDTANPTVVTGATASQYVQRDARPDFLADQYFDESCKALYHPRCGHGGGWVPVGSPVFKTGDGCSKRPW